MFISSSVGETSSNTCFQNPDIPTFLIPLFITNLVRSSRDEIKVLSSFFFVNVGRLSSTTKIELITNNIVICTKFG